MGMFCLLLNKTWNSSSMLQKLFLKARTKITSIRKNKPSENSSLIDVYYKQKDCFHWHKNPLPRWMNPSCGSLVFCLEKDIIIEWSKYRKSKQFNEIKFEFAIYRFLEELVYSFTIVEKTLNILFLVPPVK